MTKLFLVSEIVSSAKGPVAIGFWNDRMQSAKNEPGRPTALSLVHEFYGQVAFREQPLPSTKGEFVSRDIVFDGEPMKEPKDYAVRAIDMFRDVCSNRRELLVESDHPINLSDLPLLFGDTDQVFQSTNRIDLTADFPWCSSNSSLAPAGRQESGSDAIITGGSMSERRRTRVDLFEQARKVTRMRSRALVDTFYSEVSQIFNVWLPTYFRWENGSSTVGFMCIMDGDEDSGWNARLLGERPAKKSMLRGFAMRFELVVDDFGEPLLRHLNRQTSKLCGTLAENSLFRPQDA